MVYVKKTTGVFRFAYTLVAGLILLAWVLLFGVSNKDNSNPLVSGPTKAYADTPGNCSDGNDGNDGYDSNDSNGGTDGGCGNEMCGDSASCCDCDMNF